MSQLGTGRPGPRYIERGGDSVFRPPFVATGTRTYFFPVEGRQDKVQRFLDRSFEEPSEGAEELEAIGSYVLVNFIEVPRFGSLPPDEALGTLPETELSIWVPARDRRRGGRLVWAVAYMFVDNGPALSGGREIYGFPKQLAEFRISRDEGEAFGAVEVRTLAIRRHDPSAQGEDLEVVRIHEIERRRAVEAGADELATATEELCRHRPDRDEVPDLLRRVFDAAEHPGAPRGPAGPTARGLDPAGPVQPRADLAEMLASLGNDVVDGDLTMVLLKQFRDCQDPELACYQAIVEVRNQLSAVPTVAFERSAFRVAFSDLDSQHVREQLGIEDAVQQPPVVLRLHFDFIVRPGRVLWRAFDA